MKHSMLATVGLVGVAALTLAGCSASGGDDTRPRHDHLQQLHLERRQRREPSDDRRRVRGGEPRHHGRGHHPALCRLRHRPPDRPRGRNRERRLRHRVLQLRRSTRRTACSPRSRSRTPRAYKPVAARGVPTDGTQYALPSSFSDVVLYYNKDLFDAAGLDYPTSDWTWADEKAAAEALTDQAAGVWGDHQPVSFYEYYKALAQNGGEFLAADGKSVAFNSPEGIEAAEWLVDKSGTVMPTIEQGQGTPDFDTNLFKDGKLAMLHTGIWVFGAVADVPVRLGHRGRAGQHRAGQRRVLERGRRERDLGARRGRGEVGRVPHLVGHHGRRAPRLRLGAAAHLG